MPGKLLVTFEVEDHSDMVADSITLSEAAHQWAEAVIGQPTNLVVVQTYRIRRES